MPQQENKEDDDERTAGKGTDSLDDANGAENEPQGKRTRHDIVKDGVEVAPSAPSSNKPSLHPSPAGRQIMIRDRPCPPALQMPPTGCHQGSE